ncbi:snaclec mucetin subunit beta-like [Acanthaster planci]|uniref:Snaclec mucetin subunit beta-like n=1 Tax=Acanthaster planci TaxID=133434 RepID=A0A8B7Z393_ACAPL|nr:snaclec mucetin subunit beta-like [Acanthaster planci]
MFRIRIFIAYATITWIVNATKDQAFYGQFLTCPTGWLKWQESCYILLPRKMNFNNASRVCNEPGTTMIVPDSQEEHDFIWHKMKIWMQQHGAVNDSDLQVWIGCKNTDTSQLRCQGETDIHTYRNWGPSQPDSESERCVRMAEMFGGKWGDHSCGMLFHVVCERKANFPGHCRSLAHFVRVPQTCLLNHDYKSSHVRGFEECALMCWVEPLCYSFNLLHRGDGELICQLNHAGIAEADEVHVDIQNNCSLYIK